MATVVNRGGVAGAVVVTAAAVGVYLLPTARLEPQLLVQQTGEELRSECAVRGDGLPHFRTAGPDTRSRVVPHEELTPEDLAHLMSLPLPDPSTAVVQELLAPGSTEWACKEIKCRAFKVTPICPKRGKPKRRCVEGEKRGRRSYDEILAGKYSAPQRRPPGCELVKYVPEPSLALLAGAGIIVLGILSRRRR